MWSLGETYPVPIMHLVDRPFIQHVVEILVGQGRKDLDIILSHLPQQIEDLLGDGSRWGCTIKYHLVRDVSLIGRALKTIAERDEKPCLLVDATAIPQVDLSSIDKETISRGPVFFCEEERNRKPDEPFEPWSGWAWLPTSAVHIFPVLSKLSDLYHWARVRYRKRCTVVTTPRVLKINTYAGLLDAHNQVLAKDFTGLMLTGREVEEGIWLSRDVTIEPGVQLLPPVFIGQNTRIGRKVSLGPYAVAGRNCVIDDRCTISNAVIFPYTYVGEYLEMEEVLVDKNRLINVHYTSETTITDDFLLSNVRGKEMQKWLSGGFSILFAYFLLAIALPLLPFIYLTLKARGLTPAQVHREAVILPAEFDSALWKTYSLTSVTLADRNGNGETATMGRFCRHFLTTFLPGLISVARGHVQVVGVLPRTKDEILAMDHEWRLTYMRAKAGLITESFINFGADASLDELFSAEIIYSSSFNRARDLKLLGRYFGALGRELFSKSDT